MRECAETDHVYSCLETQAIWCEESREMMEECKTFQTLGKPVLIVWFQAHPIIVLWLSVLRSRFCPQESFATICSCLEIKKTNFSWWYRYLHQFSLQKNKSWCAISFVYDKCNYLLNEYHSIPLMTKFSLWKSTSTNLHHYEREETLLVQALPLSLSFHRQEYAAARCTQAEEPKLQAFHCLQYCSWKYWLSTLAGWFSVEKKNPKNISTLDDKIADLNLLPHEHTQRLTKL